MTLTGRKKITTQLKPEAFRNISAELVAKLVNDTMQVHTENQLNINYLIDYKNGIQTILEKEKTVRPEINHIAVFNHAQMITTKIVGYFLGTPIQYIQTGFEEKKEEVDRLNRYLAYENKSTVDKELAEMQSICGTAYRLIYTDGEFADEVPFEEESLHPANTYVIYNNDVGGIPVAGVVVYDVLNNLGIKTASTIYVYTEYGRYQFEGNFGNMISNHTEYNYVPYAIGGVPVIEYPNNQWRLGDWELAIDLMDAINALQNGRLDDIDQFVQQLLVFINAEVDEATYAEMRQAGAISLTNKSNIKTDIKSIGQTFDQGGMSIFAQELEELLYAIVGIPSRNNRSGGGGDTGTAVELRDGWADLEIIARNKEATFRLSERRALRVMLTILRNKGMSTLTLLDVDVKFSRNKNNNLLVKAQAYMNLMTTKTLAPEDALEIVDLVSDPSDYITRGKTFWGASFAGLEAGNISVETSKATLDNIKNPPKDTSTTNNGTNKGNN